MQISCPECKTKLSLGQPKPGTYRPKCKHCGKTFRLKVTNDVPPKVGVGRLKPTASSATPSSVAKDKPASDRTKVERTAANLDATIDQTADISAAESPIENSAGSIAVRSGQRVSTDGSDAAKEEASPGSIASETNDESNIAPIPERLGGYKILRMLGRGAMGAVYEAKQISLDRIVALKTIRSRLADNPASLARFTREAYAAAQLTHHNVVQIYDFGEDNGRHYFSMEWVRGGPLSDLVREKGLIDPKLAAGYILQAARGLQFAHQNGMVHRDVKPANLLLSTEGVVKVADLGLVKIPDQADCDDDLLDQQGVSVGMQSGTQMTMMGTAVGTPAYMAPEQSIDAASVDHRADIYSLGCSLFYTLTGRPPFDGSVVSKVMEQHASEPLPNLANVNARIPAELNQIVQRAMAKRPQDRYPSIAEMIRALESYLGVSKDGLFSPTSEQADQWESISKQFASVTPLSRFAGPVLVAFILCCGLLSLVIPFWSVTWLLFAPVVFATTIATATIFSGANSAIGMSARRWLLSLSWFDCGVALLGVIVGLLACFAIGLGVGMALGFFVGASLGTAYHFGWVVPQQKSAQASINDAETFLRNLRIDGADETGLRSFVARYAGTTWQPLYESLFGYKSLCEMRKELRGDPSLNVAWTRRGIRDKVIETLREKAAVNRQARDQVRLAKIEERGLASQGISAAEARDQAWQMAQAIVAQARNKSSSNDDVTLAAQLKRDRQKAMFADARSGRYKRQRTRLGIAKFALGGQTRLIAGCLLLIIFSFWAQRTGLIDTVRSGDINLETITTESNGDLLGAATSNWSIGIAGLLLCCSAFVSGWRMSPFAVAATIAILFGPLLGVPDSGPLHAWMISAAIGIVIYIPGIVFGETGEP